MNKINLARIDLNLLVTFEALMDLRSVGLAADRLGRTPSAISHALARLRVQLDDPLMVKVGGRMQPSPFALTLIEEVKPILRAIQRVISPSEPFDPATSQRVFRIAMPAFPSIISDVFECTSAEAPNVKIEWLDPDFAAYPAVADGMIDLAHLGGETRLPDGLDVLDMTPWTWVTFARADHPCLGNWSMAEWLKWPHLMVRIDNGVRNPIQERMIEMGGNRRIGGLIPNFAAVAPLVARTNMLATFPPMVMVRDADTYGLRALKPPVEMPPFRVRFFWSSRLAADPGNVWFRRIVIGAFQRLQAETDARIAPDSLILPQAGEATTDVDAVAASE